MSRTGSTYEQKRPGSQLPRLRLALIVGLLLAAITTAHAGWVTKDVPGVPNEVRVWAPGVYSVATTTGAWLDRADAGTPVFVSVPSAGGAISAYLSPSNCFMGFTATGAVVKSQSCPTAASIMVTNDLKQVRFTESGAGYALAKEFGSSTGTEVAFNSTGVNSGPWNPVQESSIRPADALGVLRMGSREEALFAVAQPNKVDLVWYRDGAYADRFFVPDSVSPSRDVQAIDLFPAEASTPTALFGWVNGLYRGTLAAGNSQPFSAVPLPVAGTVTGVDMNVEAGSASGKGFGMATVVRDGGVALLSAVPAGQPQDIGTQWRVNPTLPAAAVSPRYLACGGAAFCVVAQKTPNTGNVFVYTNASAPVITVAPEPSALSEQTVSTFTVSAPDADGDAVRLVVSPGTPSGPGVSVDATPANNGDVNLTVSAGRLCQNVTVPVTITASDGLAGHDQLRNLTLQVLNNVGPDAPAVGFSQKTVLAGDPTLTIAVTPPPADPVCPIASYRWTTVSSGSPPLTVSGDKLSATFQPPSVLCNSLGESHVYRVEALDAEGVASAPTYFTLQVRPYGPPKAPFNQDVQEALISGDPVKGSAWFTPVQPAHACFGTSMGFPGVDTLWAVDEGFPLPPGVRLLAPGPVPISGSSAVTPQLGVETDACAVAHLVLSVRHYTRDGSQLPGPASKVTVDAAPVLTPVDQVTLNLSKELTTPEVVSGEVSAPGLNCLELRGEARARITLTRDDGLSREQIVPVPGRWWFSLGDVCRGATYTVKGELEIIPKLRGLEAPGAGPVASVGAFGPVATDTISVPAVELPLEPVEDTHLTVSCGEAASGTLERKLPVGPCSDLPLSWDQLSGPPLTQSTFTGQRIELTTQETDFGALIGQSVVMRATVNTGKVTELIQPVPIIAEPFIEFRRQTEPLTGSDTDLVGVSVELSNTTACGVREVEHVERLEGVDYVPGSARFNGAPVEATVEEDALTLRGLVLEGNTTGRLTYVVRPRLLGTASLRGQSFIRGVPISQPPVEPSTSSCGCAGGGSGFAALGLAGLAAVLRRRKAV